MRLDSRTGDVISKAGSSTPPPVPVETSHLAWLWERVSQYNQHPEHPITLVGVFAEDSLQDAFRSEAQATSDRFVLHGVKVVLLPALDPMGPNSYQMQVAVAAPELSGMLVGTLGLAFAGPVDPQMVDTWWSLADEMDPGPALEMAVALHASHIA